MDARAAASHVHPERVDLFAATGAAVDCAGLLFRRRFEQTLWPHAGEWLRRHVSQA